MGSTQGSAARTAERKAERHGDERAAEVTGRFEGDLGGAGAISWFDLRFTWITRRIELNEAISEGLNGKHFAFSSDLRC